MLLAKAWLPGLMVIRFCFWLARPAPVNIMSQQWSFEWHRLRGFSHWPEPRTGPQAWGQSQLHSTTRHTTTKRVKRRAKPKSLADNGRLKEIEFRILIIIVFLRYVKAIKTSVRYVQVYKVKVCSPGVETRPICQLIFHLLFTLQTDFQNLDWPITTVYLTRGEYKTMTGRGVSCLNVISGHNWPSLSSTTHQAQETQIKLSD